MTELDNLEEINLLPDPSGRSAKLNRSNQKNWRKFYAVTLQRPKWKRQLGASHAASTQARMRNKDK